MDELVLYAVGGGAAVLLGVGGLIVSVVKRASSTGGESSGADQPLPFSPVPIVRHLIAKRWQVGDQDRGLWAYEPDAERNRGLSTADDERLAKLYEERGFYGYVTTHFMSFGKARWSSDEGEIRIEVQLYWDTHATQPEVKMQLSRSTEDSTPSGMEAFATGIPGFDHLFRSRFASRATAQRLVAGRERLAWVEQFAATWGRFIREIQVTDAIEAKLDRNVLQAGEPVQMLEALLQAFDYLATAIETAIDPSYVKAAPPDETVDRYVAVQVLTQCTRCKAGLPLNGPLRNVDCNNCLSSLELEASFWDLFEDPDKNFRRGQGRYQRNFTTDFSWKVQAPRCGKCEAELPVAEIPVGTDGAIHCVACGTPSATFPAPAWLRSLVPSVAQVYGAERDREDGGMSSVQVEDVPAPVAMACPQCNGGLTITAQMDRTIKCQYCQTDVFLPDALWKRLHPVKLATSWYLRLAPRT